MRWSLGFDSSGSVLLGQSLRVPEVHRGVHPLRLRGILKRPQRPIQAVSGGAPSRVHGLRQVLRLTGLSKFIKRKKVQKTGDEEQGSVGSFASWQAPERGPAQQFQPFYNVPGNHCKNKRKNENDSKNKLQITNR